SAAHAAGARDTGPNGAGSQPARPTVRLPDAARVAARDRPVRARPDDDDPAPDGAGSRSTCPALRQSDGATSIAARDRTVGAGTDDDADDPARGSARRRWC